MINSCPQSYIDHSGLYTDYYQLTMTQGYFLQNKHQQRATFDYSFRSNPFGGGYTLFAGLHDLLDALNTLSFDDDSLAYLKNQGFTQPFLDYLKHFRFKGDLLAAQEGEVVFPGEPIIRVSGTLAETQLVETLLLNLINFQSLIATKAARMKDVAGNRALCEFGLRRAQGLAGIHASRAAIIGGFDSTSNVYAAKRYNIPVIGTMAHSWIQSFDTELSAFRAYAALYPMTTTLLVDTYNTLESGIPNAITVAQEMRKKGHQLNAIRLDSGDLAYLSKQARQRLDAAGLQEVKIVVSNQLDEYVIKSLINQGGSIDAFGIGTRLVTGQNQSALDGVFKLSQIDQKPTLKISDNIEKTTLPGIKKVVRYFNEDGLFCLDGICLDDEENITTIQHPLYSQKITKVSTLQHEPLLAPVMINGEISCSQQSVQHIASWSLQRRAQLDNCYDRFENPHVYKVGITEKLAQLREKIIDMRLEDN